jgi:uncharacterized membrane protein YccF (DUF307 family)
VKSILNILRLLLSGLWMALAYVVFGVIACITIIGIPFGIANFKMIPISLLPLGRDIVRTGQPYAQGYAAAAQHPALPPNYPQQPYQPPRGR